jgi:hypothetical protein
LKVEISQANTHPPQPLKAKILFTSTTQRFGPNAEILMDRKRIKPYYKQKQEIKMYREIKRQK